MHAQQLRCQRGLHSGSRLVQWQAKPLEQDLARQGISVGVKPVAAQSDEDVAGPDLRAIEEFGPVHDPDNRSCEVVFSGVIHPGQLGGLSADQGTAPGPAGHGEAFKNLTENHRIEFLATDVIQKEKRTRTDHGNVIDAMVHEVLPDRVVPAGRECDFQFRADAVHARDKDRVAHSFEVGTEQATKPADFSEHFGSVRRSGKVVDSALHAVSEVHIHPGCCIGFLWHVRGGGWIRVPADGRDCGGFP